MLDRLRRVIHYCLKITSAPFFYSYDVELFYVKMNNKIFTTDWEKAIEQAYSSTSEIVTNCGTKDLATSIREAL